MHIELKEHVKDKRKVTFKYYQSGSLYYITDLGFEFEVPIVDTGNGKFQVEENAINFMKWINKQLEENEKARI